LHDVHDVHDVDGAGGGEGGHRDAGDAGERGVVVERRGERAARLGQEARALGGGLGQLAGGLHARQVAGVLLGPLALDRVEDRPREVIAVEPALHEVVLRALAHRPDRGHLVVEAGEHHQGDARRRGVGPDHRLDALRVGEREIEERHVDAALAEQLEPVGEAGRLHELGAERGGLLEQLADEARVARVVLDQEHVAAIRDHDLVTPSGASRSRARSRRST
jgi:hypothetical protein